MAEYRDGLRRQIERRNLIDREIKPSLEVTEDQLRHFYARQNKENSKDIQYHLAHIVVGNHAEAMALYNQLKTTPERFEELAKTSGGDLGFLSTSSLSAELKKAVPKMAVGTFSAPLKTSGGYHILKLIDTRTSDFGSLPKEKKEALRNMMVNSEVEKKMLLWLERKRSEAHIVRMGEKQTDE
jgi:parvulin-like peptidyl-prolyl isomerase